MSELIQLIPSLGFPIVCSIALAIFVYKQNQAHTAEIKAITEANKEEIKLMSEKHAESERATTEAVNNNTIVLKQILEHYRGE